MEGQVEESSTSPKGFNEPNFRLNIKRNYKGDFGFEYTIKGDTIQQIEDNNFDMQSHLYNQGLIAKKPRKGEANQNSQTNLPGSQ